jgi:type II secretory pathway predicted ATPase ExeA
MSRAPWVSHFGFTRTPFSKSIPAGQLCDRASHQEAVARMRFCIGESLLLFSDDENCRSMSIRLAA